MGHRTASWGDLPRGSRIFVDTAPLIYLFEDDDEHLPAFQGLFEAIESGHLLMMISALTLAELLTGPLRAGQTGLARRYESVLCQHQVVPINSSVAVLGAKLRADHDLPMPDALQVAAAIEGNAALMVTHGRDYSGISALPIVEGIPS